MENLDFIGNRIANIHVQFFGLLRSEIMWYGHWGWGMMWFSWIFWLAMALIIIWLV
jgi:hypothetical protein